MKKTEKKAKKKHDCGYPPSGDGFAYEYQWQMKAGNSQSPIDICAGDVVEAAVTTDESSVIIEHIAQQGASVIDNGHTVAVLTQNSTATIRGRHFKLAQVHFHTPSEHKINGMCFPLEGQFVFKAQDGRLAVIAVLYHRGAHNQQFAAIIRAARRGLPTPLKKFHAAKLMPVKIQSYFHYLGSLTIPPLTESVEWYVLTQTVEVSQANLDAFRYLYSYNARSVQPLDGRPLLKYTVMK